jgi:NIMA (never in mitosis gene a)-related kinase
VIKDQSIKLFFNSYLKMTCVKDFELLKKLGQGSFSSVFKVRRKSDGQEYAMKKVKMNGLSNKEKVNALNEVRILASIQSPYIVFKKKYLLKD